MSSFDFLALCSYLSSDRGGCCEFLQFQGGLVCEYIGEVITQVEATKRERSYSQLGLFYLHDIHGKGRYTKV